ncbi:hypothetical protein Tco_1116033 [Tanacetum coccineum]
MIGHSLDGYLDELQFGVRLSGGGEDILHVVNRLIEDRGDDVGLSMLLVDLKNAFNWVDREIRDSFILCLHAWYLDDNTIVGDTLVKGKPKEDPRSMIEGVFLPNIARPLHGVKLLGGPASVDFDFSCEFVMKRLTKDIGLMDAVAKTSDPQ